MKKIVCIIPARGGSKGLKLKNVRLLNKKPLIYYPIDYALKSKIKMDIFVSTDSVKIAAVAKKFGAEVPFLRKKKYSLDHTTTEETLKNALLEYEEYKKVKYDYCIFLTATDIFRDKKWISIGLKKMINDKKLESVFVGYKTHKNFWQKNANNKWQRLKGWMARYESRQTRRHIVREDTGLFSISKANLWRKGIRIGNNVDIIEHEEDFSFIDIHNEKDLKIANLIFKKFQ